MTELKIRLAVIVNNEVIKTWDLDNWDLDDPMVQVALMSEVGRIKLQAKEDADARS